MTCSSQHARCLLDSHALIVKTNQNLSHRLNRYLCPPGRCRTGSHSDTAGSGAAQAGRLARGRPHTLPLATVWKAIQAPNPGWSLCLPPGIPQARPASAGYKVSRRSASLLEVPGRREAHTRDASPLSASRQQPRRGPGAHRLPADVHTAAGLHDRERDRARQPAPGRPACSSSLCLPAASSRPLQRPGGLASWEAGRGGAQVGPGRSRRRPPRQLLPPYLLSQQARNLCVLPACQCKLLTLLQPCGVVSAGHGTRSYVAGIKCHISRGGRSARPLL